MTHAMLFHRLKSNNTDKATVPDPRNLPSGQKLLFTPPGDMAQKISDSYTNNIVRKIPPRAFGRNIVQTDEGVAGWIIPIAGDFLAASGDSAVKIHKFRILPQGDDYHKRGVFGLWYPQGPGYVQDDLTYCPTGLSIDPDTAHGLMIETATLATIGATKEVVDFTINFSYGGAVA
jgi:hypothetical protein